MKLRELSYVQHVGLLWEAAPEKILSAGVSPAFVAGVLEANLDDEALEEVIEADASDPEAIEVLIEWALEDGEFGCWRCGDFYVLTEVSVDPEGRPRCPECGGVLRSPLCACCGAPLYEDSRGYAEKPFHGFYLCPECFERADERKRVIEAVRK